MDDRLLEPAKEFKEYYKEKFDENAKKYFDGLVKQSGIDVEQNRKTAKEYEKMAERAAQSAKALSQKKAVRGFLIALCVLGGVALGIGIYIITQGNTIGYAVAAAGFAVFLSMLLVILLVLKPQIAKLQKEFEERQRKANELLIKAHEQMKPLNDLFDGTATKKLVEETVPLIQLDDDFNMRRYDYLSGKYGFGENLDVDCSTIAVLTGEILGNPFVVDREVYKFMGSQTYTGSIVIHWTTTYRDSQGHLRTQHHSQTLTASVTKPKPFYSQRTRLIYGNEAAPDLTFTHSPSHAERLSEKQLASKIAKGTKAIRKLQKKQLKNGESNFTEMGNPEFDVLFGATDRNNEVQFRLLFTPLAQKNMLTLMKNRYGFGDDFSFRKAGCLNYISSEHSAYWEPDIDYRRYRSYSVDKSLAQFVSINANYFKSLFFDLAPLLSIPLYQQHKPKEYIYKETYERNYTSYEAECAANKMGQGYFAHASTQTDSILKTKFLCKDGDSDKVRVTAHSFRIEKRTDFIPVFGGDGRMHTVPVVWDEYIPVMNERVVSIKRLGVSDREFDRRLDGESALKKALDSLGCGKSYIHGLLCCLLNSEEASFDADINRVLNK